MRLSPKVIIIASAIAFVLGVAFYLFGLNHKMVGLGWGSYSIEESRELGMYLHSYKPSQSTLRMFGDVVIDIEEIWVEKYWTYGLLRGTTNREPNEGGANERYYLSIRCAPRGDWNMFGSSQRPEEIIYIVYDTTFLAFDSKHRRFHTVIVGLPPDSLRMTFVRESLTGGMRFPDTGAVITATRVGKTSP